MRPGQAGFSLVESLIGAALLSIVAVTVMALVGLYFGLVVQARQQQELDSHADALIATFRAGESCTRHLETVWGDLPYAMSSAFFEFSKIDFDGARVDPRADAFPGFPPGRLLGVTLTLGAPPLPRQKTVRGDVKLFYRLEPDGVVRQRRAAVFFGLTPDGRIERCLDAAAYRRLDAQEEACRRLGGILGRDGACDASTSALVKRRTCEAAGLKFVGGACALN